MKFTKILHAAASLSAAALIGAGAAQAAERLSLSTWGSPKHFQVEKFVPVFEKLLEEKSGGEFRMKTFMGGEMLKQQFVASGIPQGTVDISLTTLDNWSGQVPEVSILTTPLWTHSMEWTRDNMKPGNPVFDYFDAKFRDAGAVIIALFDIGPPVLSSNFEVTGPESFEGKAIRVYSKGSGIVVQALGGAPTIMGVGDVYSGLQRGTVDGALGGLGGAVGLKHYEVTDHMFMPNGVLGTLLHGYVMNKDKFDSLSPEQQDQLMSAATEARDQMQQFGIDSTEKLVQVVRDSGNTVTAAKPGTPLWDAFATKLEPLADDARATYPAELVELIAAK
ncbi:TRAP transporter substrate-binding protein [Brevirhabdus sp.]|uniref:TRAP transporter substrate-binding protein n=1 Tax=Brevirhabdus sp. TaxID=2004514 RepID=UPI004059A421